MSKIIKLKTGMTKEVANDLAAFWAAAKPIDPDHTFLTGDVVGFADGLRVIADGHTAERSGQTVNVGGHILLQLHNGAGELTGLAEIDPTVFNAQNTRRGIIFAPHGYARGHTVIGDDAAAVTWLCESIYDAWAILRTAQTVARCVVYWSKSNLKYVVDALAGQALAIVADHVWAGEIKADDFDHQLATVVKFTATPATMFAFGADDELREIVDDYAKKYIILPHTPSDNEQEPTLFGKWSIEQMIDNIYLIYGTDTCFDAVNRMQMRLSHLKHSVGTDIYKFWVESERRKTVKGLVFEPNGQHPRHTVNLFDGLPAAKWPRVTDAASCDRIIQHVRALCGGRGVEFDFLIKWMAYPLQNLGAKMDSSVIMYGSEGPGKSVLFEKVLSKIYGDYAVTIGQAQLESQFTGWQSGKLFALCEEVVSRAERSQHKGQLKHLVTGSTVMINEKNLPLREEANHVNFVFLSNSTIPLELDMGDRRYLVLYANDVPDKTYFDDLFKEINNGGVREFYHYLMSLDLTGFNEHTRPPLNIDKERLIEASLPNPVLFFKEWSAGDLSVPYGSCAKADLFRLYRRWCVDRNEYPKRDRDFTAELRRYMTDDRKDLCYPQAKCPKKTVRVWVTNEDKQNLLTKDNGIELLNSVINRFAYNMGSDSDE